MAKANGQKMTLTTGLAVSATAAGFGPVSRFDIAAETARWRPFFLTLSPPTPGETEVSQPGQNCPIPEPFVLARTWQGRWQNDFGESGTDSLTLSEDAGGRLVGTWSGNVPVTGKRTSQTTIDLTGRTATRSYQLTGFVAEAGLQLKYTATRLDSPGSYKGAVSLARAK